MFVFQKVVKRERSASEEVFGIFFGRKKFLE